MNIKRIELYDLMYWDPSGTPQWKPLYGFNGTANFSLGPGSQHSVVLYEQTGFGWNPESPYAATIMWDYLTVNDGSGITEDWTIFGAAAPLIATATVSIRIKYRLRVTDMADPANVITPAVDYFQIIKAAYPTDHISYSTGGTTGPWSPVVTVYLPGMSTAMLANPAALFTWLNSVNNWQVVWTRPDLTTRTVKPVSVSITNEVSAIAQYAGARVKCILTLPQLAIGQSGSHILQVSLLPNDQQESGYFDFDDTHTWTATITALTPTIEAPLYMSFDSGVFMEILFTQ